MISYDTFLSSIQDTQIAALGADLLPKLQQGLCTQRFGDLPKWLAAFNNMPNLEPSVIELKDAVRIGTAQDATPTELEALEVQLRALIPWRKGPFHLFDIHIDTEWRSDWKWDRLLPFLPGLTGQHVLDIGCGNGYHCFRMFGAGAARVVGIDPSPRFAVQFEMVKKYLPQHTPVDLLPIGVEALPANLQCFDTVFSMGVLYHRKSPIDHLYQLKECLTPGGHLILETLTINGGENDVLVPSGRYAMMNNVWFLPSNLALAKWLNKCGFTEVECVDTNVTSLAEQRQTDWMIFHSLAQFLDPNDRSMTQEGHPAPQRSIFIARKPC